MATIAHEDEYEVLFYKYCGTCKYAKLEEVKFPCNECLAIGNNPDSSRPIYWTGKNTPNTPKKKKKNAERRMTKNEDE